MQSPTKRKLKESLLGVLALLTGCYADQPIGPVAEAVFDERLLGRWQFPQTDGGEMVELVVLRFNESEYVVSPARDFSAKEALRFHITEVDGQRFINAQDLDPDLSKRTYMFARYHLPGPNEGLLEVPELDAVPHEAESSAQLAELFARGDKIQGFYKRDKIVVRRVPEH